MPKEKKKTGPSLRHQPLAVQMSKDGSKVRERPRKQTKDEGKEAEESYMGREMTKRVLEQARAQREEEEHAGQGGEKKEEFFHDLESEPEDYGSGSSGESDDELVVEEGGYVDAKGVSESEERLLGAFMGGGIFQSRNLADMIMEKIREKEEGDNMDEGEEQPESLPPKVVEVYTQLGQVLKHYTAGKLPKAFKIMPSLRNWEEVMLLTNPYEWSPHSCLAVTKMFSSNLTANQAQRYYNVFLLERCRADIAENKRLNYHLYQALKKSMYKPSAFFKGILLPLAASNSCTLREAHIFGSVLASVSIPANHSAVALLKLAQMPYSGATSTFMKILLNKKYSLPHKVIDALVDQFMGFCGETRELPVLWHQSLLILAQRYKCNIRSREDKERLKELLKAQHHVQITPEIRRELFSGECRREQRN
ncbi:unnamed protein product [Chrysoparadoxa australica]